MTTTTFYRVYRSDDGGTTWQRLTQLTHESVAREWYDEEQRLWLLDNPRFRLKLVRVTVVEMEEIVASTGERT